jgi:hypothetical protein
MDRQSPPSPNLLKLIWVVILTSPLAFIVVAWMLSGPEQMGGAGVGGPLVLGLGVVSFAMFLVGAGLLERMLPSSSSIPEVSRGFTLFMIRIALFEAIAFLGLTASLVSGSFLVYVPFMFLSLTGMVLFRPRQ